MDELNKLELFFKLDLKIKECLYKAAFNTQMGFDENYLVNYSNQLYDSVNYIIDNLEYIIEMYFPQLCEPFNIYFKKLKEELIECGSDYYRLKKFYETRVSNMSPEFLDSLKSNVFGYFVFNDINKVLNYTCTLNEILHLLHHAIINNEKGYQKIDQNYVINISDYDFIEVRGKDTEFSRKLADTLYNTNDPSIIHIIELENKTIVMMRDRGHATTLEIEKNNDYIQVKYFIPKIINKDKVNLLKGIQKVEDDNQRYASGDFSCRPEEFFEVITSFVNSIPTDLDLIPTR